MICSRFRTFSSCFKLSSIITLHYRFTRVFLVKRLDTRQNLLQYSFCSQKKSQSQKRVKHQLVIKQLLQLLEKDKDSFNVQQQMNTFNILSNAINKGGKSFQQTIQISKCIQLAFKKYSKVTQNQANVQYHQSHIFRTVNFLCLQNVRKLLQKTQQKTSSLQTVRNPQFLSTLLSLFQKVQLNNKSQTIKFIACYHQKNLQANTQIRQLLKRVPQYKLRYVNEAIFFVKQLVSYYKETDEGNISKVDESIPLSYLQTIIKYVEDNIMLVDPKMLHIFTNFLVQMKSHERGKNLQTNFVVIETGVSEHIEGLNIIESFNSIDVIYLLQVLENIIVLSAGTKKGTNWDNIRKSAGKIYEMIYKIHGSDFSSPKQPQDKENDTDQIGQKKQQEAPQNQITSQQNMTRKHQLRLIDINIILESMLKVSVIDPHLFALLEKCFFKRVVSSGMMDIQCYVLGRIRVARAVMENLRSDKKQNTPEKLRLIKQEHIKFIKNLLQAMNANPSLSLREKLKILQVCQKIPVKSRAIKKAITAILSGENVEPEEVGFGEIIIAGF